ncbi:MAG: flagella biosynthesis chaperone FliJ [Oxalobacter sp.]|jgi:flagellar FliJ protein|nr:MAG: flagella biosynthesis chaperone FliJ [Oxalobacter sp.]
MASSSAINMLIELATRECDKAAQELGKSIRFADETEKKLTMLLQYRDEYRVRFEVNQAEGLSIEDYRNYQIFLEKLEQAISGQLQIVTDSKKRVEKCQKLWQSAEHKKMSYDTLAERKQKEAQRKESRRDQKETDEFAARASQNKQ